MLMPIAMALMGKNLYDKHQDAKKRDAEGAEDRAFTVEQRERQRKQWSDDDAFKTELGMQGQTAKVEPNMVKSPEQDNIDVGQPGEPPPSPQGFRVNGQVFASMEDANKAAESWNAPDAIQQRRVATMRKHNRHADATALERDDQQRKLAGLQLSNAQRGELLENFNQGVLGTKDWGGLATAASNTKAVTGDMKFEFAPTEDGKGQRLYGLTPDGKRTDTGKTYASLREAQDDLIRHASTHDHLTYRREQEETRRRAAHDKRQFDHQDEQLELRRTEVKQTGEYQRRMVAVAGARASHAGDGAGLKLPQAVQMQAQHLNKQIDRIDTAIASAQAQGTFDPNNTVTAEMLKRKAALGHDYDSLMQKHMPPQPGAGDVLGFVEPPKAQEKAPAATPKTSAPASSAKPIDWRGAAGGLGAAVATPIAPPRTAAPRGPTMFVDPQTGKARIVATPATAAPSMTDEQVMALLASK